VNCAQYYGHRAAVDTGSPNRHAIGRATASVGRVLRGCGRRSPSCSGLGSRRGVLGSRRPRRAFSHSSHSASVRGCREIFFPASISEGYTPRQAFEFSSTCLTLRLLAAMRWSIREQGGEPSSPLRRRTNRPNGRLTGASRNGSSTVAPGACALIPVTKLLTAEPGGLAALGKPGGASLADAPGSP
jgi:hypothetical protein